MAHVRSPAVSNKPSWFSWRYCITFSILFLLLLFTALLVLPDILGERDKLVVVPTVINTWNFERANDEAWKVIFAGGSALNAVELGCTACELDQCDGTVGYGGSPDENGETTLDAMIMDGATMNIGAVAAMREIKSAISVARHVLDNTQHSLIVGERATEFAERMGFKRETLTTNVSRSMWTKWKADNCQPNFWMNVRPDAEATCGPYSPLPKPDQFYPEIDGASGSSIEFDSQNHDTIGLLAVDMEGNIAAGTSTNGARFKIPGRVGDSPIPGSGAYAENGIGAAAATGNGDVMMRFAPSFLAVELLRQGKTAFEAANEAILRILKFYPRFEGAVIVTSFYGDYSAACAGMKRFPFIVHQVGFNRTLHHVECQP
ncbi:unnamed protein product [Bemisia tabaci]|uniref:N(4)-(beta-N-acetylglucosaminyl)-L-asparaginase n=1 Tax=Bemisia tabaci TaxID=7038 RepID=A0A9P0F551_BEMTA|nr:unnamed protein product [Bemisia tabaci]